MLSALVCIVIAVQFWAGSRFPALDQKAMMAGTAGMEPLAFDTILAINPEDPTLQRVVYGFVNWAKTNQRGMTFGFMFAAAILTMLSLLKQKSLNGNFSNSALGVLIGTPLGVCVNCAAPIARGLHASGMRLETTIATMISSPTLNIVVIAMLLSLFPLYMVLIKVGFTLIFLFFVLPLLSRYMFKKEVLLTDHHQAEKKLPDDSKFIPLEADAPTKTQTESWFSAIKWLVKNLANNLWFIVKTTFPLMILAGFLGSLVVTLMPLDSLADFFPGKSAFWMLVSMCLIALVGIFLPVPIAFDVVVSAVLMSAGMPVKYVMVLLFTLGIYSIYSYFIVQQILTYRVALTLFVSLAAIGVLAGVIAHEYDQWDTKRKRDFLFSQWQEIENIDYEITSANPGKPAAQILPLLAVEQVKYEMESLIAPANIKVSVQSKMLKQAANTSGFTRQPGQKFGVDQPYQVSIHKWIEPFAVFRGLSTGDVHNDGWPDLVVTSEKGIFLYANNQGTFIPQKIEVEGILNEYIINAALIDIDNDGWLDLYYGTYRKGNYIIYNAEGRFTQENQILLPGLKDTWVTPAPAFADLDLDGDLDIILGNWTLGEPLLKELKGRQSSTTTLLWNNNGKFEAQPLIGDPGETLTVLVTDLNDDGRPDIIVGNDFEIPDMYILGQGNGQFKLLSRKENLVEVTTRFTMSAIVGDLNNDLKKEIFLANISGTNNSEMRKIGDICDESQSSPYYEQCKTLRADQALLNRSIQLKDPYLCKELKTPGFSDQCIGFHIFNEAWKRDKPERCALLSQKFKELATICTEYEKNHQGLDKNSYDEIVPQARARLNILLQKGEDKFSDKAIDWGVREMGWVWTAQFADLNQDEYLDLYAGTGTFSETTSIARENNMFYLNDAGKRFVEKTKEFGLDMFAETAAFVYIDFDNDGDLDIVALESAGPVWIYTNNESTNNSISFSLDDAIGNRQGIGSSITIRYAENGTHHQIRELNAGGAFMSFGSMSAHFGLNRYDTVSEVSVHWSTGETSILLGDFKSGHHYTIGRL